MEDIKATQRKIMELRAANRLYLRRVKENDLKIEKLRGEIK